MAQWTKQKVDSNNLNNGNEYVAGSQLSLNAVNAIVNSGLFSQDFAEHLADVPDNSTANAVGTPTVTLIDNVVGGITYKKFKFSNLKGANGKGISSIEKISDGTTIVDTYRIYYDDNTYWDYQVTNGSTLVCTSIKIVNATPSSGNVYSFYTSEFSRTPIIDDYCQLVILHNGQVYLGVIRITDIVDVSVNAELVSFVATATKGDNAPTIQSVTVVSLD